MIKIQDLKYWKQGQEFLQVKIPIISGAMTWISDSGLVNAVSRAGGMGILAAGNMPVETFKKEVKILKEKKARFGVNLITLAPTY